MHRIFSFLFPDIAKSIGVLLAKAVVIACFQLISILPANATEPPVCTGKNLLAEMERSDPQALAALRKQAAETPNGKGIFWKIERAGTEPSYLLGTSMDAPDFARAKLAVLAAPAAAVIYSASRMCRTLRHRP